MIQRQNEFKLKETILYKEIAKVHLSTEMKNKPPKGKEYAIKEIKNGNLLAFCSEDYKLKKNTDIYKPFELLLVENNIRFNQYIHIVDCTKFYVDYVIVNNKMNAPGMLPLISIWNSYDGTVKTQIKFGYQLQETGSKFTRPCVCNIHTSSKHSTDNSNEFINSFFSSFQKFMKSEIPADIKCFERMNKKKVEYGFIEKLMNNLKFSKESKQITINYFSQKEQRTLFNVYESVNHAIYNSNQKELPEIKLKKDIINMEYVSKLLI